MSRTTKYSPPEDLCMQFYGTEWPLRNKKILQIVRGALYCSLWSTGFEKGYGNVVRVTME